VGIQKLDDIFTAEFNSICEYGPVCDLHECMPGPFFAFVEHLHAFVVHHKPLLRNEAGRVVSWANLSEYQFQYALLPKFEYAPLPRHIDDGVLAEEAAVIGCFDNWPICWKQKRGLEKFVEILLMANRRFFVVSSYFCSAMYERAL
jgi:hypothetical protein